MIKKHSNFSAARSLVGTRYFVRRFFLLSLIATMTLSCTRMNTQPQSSATAYALSPASIIKHERAALRGDHESALRLGHFHSIVKNNQRDALFWYRLSAELGNADGAINTAFLYNRLLSDFRGSMYWYCKAVDKYPGDANLAIADILAKSSIFEAAYKFYIRAIHHGNLAAANLLAEMLLELNAEAERLVEAYVWAKVWRGGLPQGTVAYTKAESLIDKISNKLAPDEVVIANSAFKKKNDQLALEPSRFSSTDCIATISQLE